MMRRLCMLSTVNNPYNPFTEFHKWYKFDQVYEEGCAQYLAKVCLADDEMLPADYDEEVERAIDEIIEMNPRKIYIKVVHEEEDPNYNDERMGLGT